MGGTSKASARTEGAANVPDRIANAHKLSDPVKCLWVSGITLPFLCGWLFRFHRLLDDPTASRYVSRDFLPTMLTYQWVQTLGHVAIILAALLLIRLGKERASWLVHFEIQWWIGCFAFSLYALGPFTSPFATLVLILPVGGLLIFSARPMVYGLSMLALYSVAMFGLERAGLIPYAPFLDHPPFENGRLVDGWIFSVGAPAVFASVLVLVIYSWVVVQWRLREEELEALIGTDPLTGIANRRVFFERLAEEIARAGRHQRALTVMMMDVDHFKEVNDTHGHQIGDRVLRGVAERLVETLRAADLVARYGGEEFALILPETPPEMAASAAERIRAAVHGHSLESGAGSVSVTASLGVATLKPGEELDQLVSRADSALYLAKNGGRDRVEVAA